MRGKRGYNNLATRLFALLVALMFAVGGLPASALADDEVGARQEPPIPGIIAQSAGNFTTWRLAGGNRYQTMALIVAEAYTSANDAVVCSGESYQDGLAASALAGIYRCPLLTTEPNELNVDTKNQLERLGVRHVMIVGDESDVSKSVESSLKSAGRVVERIKGTDDIDTSVQLMGKVRSSGSNSNTVVVAASSDYADALSISPWSYESASPIIYAEQDGNLGDAAALAIKKDETVKRVVIVGGKKAVTDSVIQKLGADYEYVRLAGSDRYETSAGVASWATKQGLKWDTAGVATGLNYADALPGGAAMGYKHAPLLLVHGAEDPAVNLIKERNAEIYPCYIFGGSQAVPDALAAPTLYGAPTGSTTTTGTSANTNTATSNTNANTPTVANNNTSNSKLSSTGDTFPAAALLVSLTALIGGAAAIVARRIRK
jgi:putative cell wall-binding protein